MPWTQWLERLRVPMHPLDRTPYVAARDGTPDALGRAAFSALAEEGGSWAEDGLAGAVGAAAGDAHR